MSETLGALERAVINRFQGGLPVVRRPFSAVAARLDTDEATLISTLERLLTDGWLTRVGPLFNPDRMGGGLSLCAMCVPEDRFDEVSETVNALPAVAHNYARAHPLNMWFVVATETPAEVPATLDQVREATGLEVYDFPKRREFYLGLWLQLDDQGPTRTRSLAMACTPEPSTPLDATDRRIVTACQAGLPLVPEPFGAVAEQVGQFPDEVMRRIERMRTEGVIRRIGVVPNHYRLGLRGNGMSVWDVPDDRLDEIGRRVGAMDFVSHCYERPRHAPFWPYNLFAMVHGRDRAEVSEKVHGLARTLGDRFRAHEVLFSTRILKKTGLRLTV
jgi:DNA-binding Lrp family transcriptional regulator